VTRLAQDWHDVHALVRPTSKTDHLPKERVSLITGDLKDKESLRRAICGIEVVFHAGAAVSGPREELETSTIRGTRYMLELAQAEGVKRFVHISSLSVYQVYQLQRNAIVDETCPVESMAERIGPYAHAKVEAEKLAMAYADQGLPVVVVRPGLIYGPRGTVLFPHLGYAIKNRLFAVVGSGTNLLPLTYVDNAVEGIVLAANSETAVGRAYTIVDGDEITQKEYLRRFLTAAKLNFFVVSIPFPLLLGTVKVVEQLRKTGILGSKSGPTVYGLASKYKSLRFDTTKARTELRWSPRVTLEEGLQRTFTWYNQASRVQ
jgi:2-alkyl-3-oxoalkanoate reductase